MMIKKGVQKELYGYTGKLLRIDLSSGTSRVEELDPEMLRAYIGGIGIGVRLLYDELSPGIDPLGPENKMVFATGPFTGTRAPGSGFVAVCFKSPLTGIWGECRCGSDFGRELRRSGYDGMVLEGKAKEPSYVTINDGKVDIKPSAELKGKTTSEKEKFIKNELGDEKYMVATIGPSAEKLVRYANIMIGSRAAGRCGAGAVMASKNLLGLAVKGSGEIPVANPEEFTSFSREVNKRIRESQAKEDFNWSDGGTTQYMRLADAVGDQPTKNFRSNSSGKADEIYNRFHEKNLVEGYPCYTGCILKCGRKVKVDGAKWQTPEHGGAEYETMSAFMFYSMNEDQNAAVHAGYLCNEYGIDTISTGACIAFAMDCYDEGILTKESSDGLDLSWGNSEAMVELVHKIGKREGIGELLGEGVKRAAEKIGGGSEKLAMHLKGLEGAAHDARSSKLLALTYGSGSRGMCHTHQCEGLIFDSIKMELGLAPFGFPDPYTVDRWDPAGKGELAKKLQDYTIWPDILGICKFYTYFGGYVPGELTKLLSLLTGWEVDYEHLAAAGSRTFNLQRRFNTREGVRKKDDILPDRCRRRPEFGAYADKEECEIKDNEALLAEYYIARGWDEDGVPLERGE